MTKVFVICRDRLEPLQKLLPWIEHLDVTLIDNDSSYEPLLDFYNSTEHTVARLTENLGHKAAWLADLLPKNERFILTDPDVIPMSTCPKDFIEIMNTVLDAVPIVDKVGLGLKIDDLPEHYKLKYDVITWEQQFWARPCGEIKNVQIFDAPVDTTFALYRENVDYAIFPAARLGEPYMAQHLPWYSNSIDPTQEEIYYKDHSSAAFASWSYDEIRNQSLKAILNGK